jgi:hypothetical protein
LNRLHEKLLVDLTRGFADHAPFFKSMTHG